MGNELVPAREYTSSEIELIKDTVAKGATDQELKLFIYQCKRTGLDPFSRQIHAVKRWDAKLGREVMSIQTGIDGFRLVAERTGLYAGNDDPIFDIEGKQHPGKATCTVWKLVNGQRVPFTRLARWPEFVQVKKDGSVTHFWAHMPYHMLGKVAEALALRAAFPQELSGLYTREEMDTPQEGMAETPQLVHAAPAQPKAIDVMLISDVQREWLATQLKGKVAYANELMALLGIARFGLIKPEWWLLVRLLVEHQVKLDWFKTQLEGKKVCELNLDEIGIMEEFLKIRFVREKQPEPVGELAS